MKIKLTQPNWDNTKPKGAAQFSQNKSESKKVDSKTNVEKMDDMWNQWDKISSDIKAPKKSDLNPSGSQKQAAIDARKQRGQEELARTPEERKAFNEEKRDARYAAAGFTPEQQAILDRNDGWQSMVAPRPMQQEAAQIPPQLAAQLADASFQENMRNYLMQNPNFLRRVQQAANPLNNIMKSFI